MLKARIENQIAFVKVEQSSTINRQQHQIANYESEKSDSNFLTYQKEVYKSAIKGKHQKVKQNKDQANAARTARIVILFIILEENGRRDLVKIFQKLNIPIDSIKSTIRNIGNKQFINQFLNKQEMVAYFIESFQRINQHKIKAVMRSNKNSSLSVDDRVKLVIKHVQKFKKLFCETHNLPQFVDKTQIQKKIPLSITQKKIVQRQKNIKQQQQQQVLCPIPLYNAEYIYYMLRQGFFSTLY